MMQRKILRGSSLEYYVEMEEIVKDLLILRP